MGAVRINGGRHRSGRRHAVGRRGREEIFCSLAVAVPVVPGVFLRLDGAAIAQRGLLHGCGGFGRMGLDGWGAVSEQLESQQGRGQRRQKDLHRSCSCHYSAPQESGIYGLTASVPATLLNAAYPQEG